MGISETDLRNWILVELQATRGPWTWYTGNSWRRLAGPETAANGQPLTRQIMVLEPFTSRADGHPDLAVTQEDMDFIACARVAMPELIEEVRRLRQVIQVGGAMYRAERAAMGIPGGFDADQNKPLRDVFESLCSKCARRYGDHIVSAGDAGLACPKETP